MVNTENLRPELMVLDNRYHPFEATAASLPGLVKKLCGVTIWQVRHRPLHQRFSSQHLQLLIGWDIPGTDVSTCNGVARQPFIVFGINTTCKVLANACGGIQQIIRGCETLESSGRRGQSRKCFCIGGRQIHARRCIAQCHCISLDSLGRIAFAIAGRSIIGT